MILASKDPVAIDNIGGLLMGHDPKLIPHLVTLHNDQMGCNDARLIRVNGIKVGDEKKDFECFNVAPLTKYTDFEAPNFSVNSVSLDSTELHFSLTVDDEVNKVEISIDSIYLNEIVVGSFDDFTVGIDTLEINAGTEVIVYAYDEYLNDSWQYANPLTFVPEVNPAANGMTLYPSRPNPFVKSTMITFNLAERSRVSIAIFDLQGKLIRTLADALLDRGESTVTWDGCNESGSEVAAGTYVCRLSASDGVYVTRRLVKAKR
jgi:hypothetical protein